MGKVTGIGGVFFKCKDPEKLKEWYNKNLGIDRREERKGRKEGSLTAAGAAKAQRTRRKKGISNKEQGMMNNEGVGPF